MSVFCPNCGKPNTDSATKCVSCGTELKPPPGRGGGKFKGTMMMSGVNAPKPPGAPGAPGGAPPPPQQPPQGGGGPVQSGSPQAKQGMAFQKTMLGPMSPPGAPQPPGQGQPPSAPPPPPPSSSGSAPGEQGSFGQQPSGGGEQPSSGGFGQQPSSGGFGQQPSSGGGFGQQPPQSGGSFGQPPQSGGGGFGQQPSSGGFGQDASSSSGGFGQPSGGGEQPSSGGFGQPPQASSGGGGFGQQPSQGGFGGQPGGGQPGGGGGGFGGGPGGGAPGGGGFGGPPGSGATAAPPKKSKKPLLFIGIGCVLLLGIGCAVGGWLACRAAEEGANQMGSTIEAETNRVGLIFTMGGIRSECSMDPSGASTSAYFHSSAFSRLQSQACQIDDNVINAFSDANRSQARMVAGTDDESTVTALGIDPTRCTVFTSGSAKIIGCPGADDAIDIVHMENLSGVQ